MYEFVCGGDTIQLITPKDREKCIWREGRLRVEGRKRGETKRRRSREGTESRRGEDRPGWRGCVSSLPEHFWRLGGMVRVFLMTGCPCHCDQ